MDAKRTPEDESKDQFFSRLADIANEMIDAHGKDFAMGAFVLAARWIAEKKPPNNGRSDAPGGGPVVRQ